MDRAPSILGLCLAWLDIPWELPCPGREETLQGLVLCCGWRGGKPEQMAAMHQPLQGGNLSLETPSCHPLFLLADLLAAAKTCSLLQWLF